MRLKVVSCLVAIALVLAVPFVSSANNTVSVAADWNELDSTKLTVEADLSGAGDITILVLRTEESLSGAIPASLSEENIVYVNQKTADSDGEASWTFTPATAACNEGDYITVFVGGTDVSTFAYTEVVVGSDVQYTGDFNDDGAVDGKDVTRLAQFLAGWDVVVYPEGDDAALDVNDDGAADGKDITRLAQYLAGWDVTIYGYTE